MNENLSEKIKQHLDTHPDLVVFSSFDFLELAHGDTIRQVLNRMAKRKEIQKIIPGFYYQPQYSDLLQEHEAVSPHYLALSIARKYNWTIAPSGLTALNRLGLSTQVPSKWSYISNGIYKKIQFNNITIEFKHKNNREITGKSYKTALVIQAIKELGQGNIDDMTIARLRDSLTETERQTLFIEGKSTLIWIFEIIKKIHGSYSNV